MLSFTPKRGRDALLRAPALHVSTPFSLLPCGSAHRPADVCLFLSLLNVPARIARERVPTACNGGSRPLSRVSPDRALAIRFTLQYLAPASGIVVCGQQTARSDPKFR